MRCSGGAAQRAIALTLDSSMSKTILLLASSPVNQAKLSLDVEAREIDECLRRSQYRDQFQLKKKGAVRTHDLHRALLDTTPQIVHFCGHGTGSDGLVFEDEQGKAQLVSTEALANLFEVFAGQIECVVLNACYSEVQAKAIVQHVGYVIGMNKAIGDKAAIKFSRGFYDALGAGSCIEDAYNVGCYAIESEGIPEHLTPVLKTNTAWKYVLEKYKQPSNAFPENHSNDANKLVDFENDIFISYAHIDNQPLSEDQKGWISDLHHFLEIRVTQLCGERARILRDPKLQGHDSVDHSIVMQFPKVALLVSVLSPRYVKSTYCMQELQEFCNLAKQTGGILLAGNKARIFKVIKTPVSPEQEPQELRSLLSYEFYEIDQAGRPHEFNKIFGSDWARKYWAKLDDLAYDISQLLETCKQQKLEEVNHIVEPVILETFKQQEVEEVKPIIEPVKPTGIKVYLAETTLDLSEARDKIRRELQQRGYIVLPNQTLPHNPSCLEVVNENLEDCQLSIHLVGKPYGIIPEGLKESVVELQYSLAKKQKQHHSEFSYLVWIPNELKAEEPRQLEFMQRLQDEPELLQTTLEELKTIIQEKLKTIIQDKLKTIIQDKLNPPQQPSKPKIEEGVTGVTQVYLICDQRDLDIIEPVANYLLEQQKWDVILPMFAGAEAEVRQEHQESLCNCDAVLIYYGQGNERWLRTKLRDLQKAAGYGRSNPMLAKAIYVAGPETPQKKRFRTRQATVIKHFQEFSPHVLEQFQVQINQSKGGLQ